MLISSVHARGIFLVPRIFLCILRNQGFRVSGYFVFMGKKYLFVLYVSKKGFDRMNQNIKMIEGQVTSIQRDIFYVKSEGDEYPAHLTGKLRDKHDIPIVGDYVRVCVDEYGNAGIVEVLPRKSFFARPDRRGHADGYVKMMKEQPMIANFDYVFIMTSLNHNFNVNRIARYATITTSGGGIPVAVLTKADLVHDVNDYIARVRMINSQMDIIAVSSLTGEGLEQIRRYFVPGTTIALLGSSGAGKSTLINTLAGTTIMHVSDIRESDSKGRHTTTHRQMVELDGVYLIDTPGMREIGMCDVGEAVDTTFEDIAKLIHNCKFSDCRHDTEPGCAVKQALAAGELTKERWHMYCNLQNESRWAKGLKHNKMVEISRKRRLKNNINHRRR